MTSRLILDHYLNGRASRNRTYDLRVISTLLYRLSYNPISRLLILTCSCLNKHGSFIVVVSTSRARFASFKHFHNSEAEPPREDSNPLLITPQGLNLLITIWNYPRDTAGRYVILSLKSVATIAAALNIK